MTFAILRNTVIIILVQDSFSFSFLKYSTLYELNSSFHLVPIYTLTVMQKKGEPCAWHIAAEAYEFFQRRQNHGSSYRFTIGLHLPIHCWQFHYNFWYNKTEFNCIFNYLEHYHLMWPIFKSSWTPMSDPYLLQNIKKYNMGNRPC